MSTISMRCPYCLSEQTAPHPGDYSPQYVNCTLCGKRFIAEPGREGVTVYRDGEAPCCSDPECRTTELGGSQED